MREAGPRPRWLARMLVLAALPLALSACDWFTDFKETPRIEPWKAYGFANGGTDSLATDTIAMRGQPSGSIPTTGVTVPVWQVSYARLPATLDSLAEIAVNPTPMSQASLDNGRMHYQINCATCHGDTGAGDGAATRFGMVPFPLTAQVTVDRPDGYIWGIMRNGRGLMPNYNRIEEMDRWDVVNYVRALQGRAAGFNVETGAIAAPGEGGAAVPRGTETSPTRPAPFVKPSTWLQPGIAPAAAAVPGGGQ